MAYCELARGALVDSQWELEYSQLAHAYATAPVGLTLLSPDLIFLRINDRLAEINGIPAGDHIGMSVADLLPDFAQQAAAMRDAFLAGGGSVTRLFAGTTPAQPGVHRQWVEHWSPLRDGNGKLTAINVAVEEVTEQRKQEERAALMMGELRHRLKNTLAIVQSIARSTFSPLTGAEEQVRTFEARLTALSHAHDLLLASEWQRAEVGALIEAAMDAVNPARFEAKGPKCYVTADGTMALTLALHELCTNAAKYGALSREAGMVRVSWTCTDTKIDMVWEETGGPPVRQPEREGFGLKLLSRILARREPSTSGMEFRPEGLVCHITVDRDQLD